MNTVPTKDQVASELNKWLFDQVTFSELAIWARESRDKWESDELELESEDLLLDFLYKISFADWLVSDPSSFNEADCSFSKEDAQEAIQKLEKVVQNA
jgi:hypothetical protein